jgi:hypothetical protein
MLLLVDCIEIVVELILSLFWFIWCHLQPQLHFSFNFDYYFYFFFQKKQGVSGWWSGWLYVNLDKPRMMKKGNSRGRHPRAWWEQNLFGVDQVHSRRHIYSCCCCCCCCCRSISLSTRQKQTHWPWVVFFPFHPLLLQVSYNINCEIFSSNLDIYHLIDYPTLISIKDDDKLLSTCSNKLQQLPLPNSNSNSNPFWFCYIFFDDHIGIWL